MNIKEKATALHESGFNCAQSVFSSCCEYTGLNRNTALAISGGFGGGVRCGEICGAVSGGVMAIGICNPYNDSDNVEAKDNIARLTKQFTGEFKETYGSIRCNDLKATDCDCKILIEHCAALAEKIIKENR